MKKYPIIILHGWNLSSKKFDGLCLKLREIGHIVVCFDLPGFGKSQPPGRPYNLSDYCDFILAQMHKKKMKKCILIGHSFGGRIGIKLVSENPHLFKAVILTGAPGINPVPQFKVAFFLTLAKIGHLIFALPVISSLSENARKFLYKTAHATDFYNTNPHMRETFKNVVAENLNKYMENMNIPTLLLWGEDDGMVPVTIARKMLNVIKNSELSVIAGARHGVPWTHPDKFVERVEKFINTL